MNASPNRSRNLKLLTVLTTMLMLLLAACTTEVKPPPPSPDEEVVIPDTTKVLDASVQAALLAADASGALRYRADAALPQLEVGDVLVGDPSPAAPYGFLRKVVAIRQQGDEIVIDTAPASLLDAVHEGSLQAHLELKPEDVAEVAVHAPGLAPQAILEGFSYSFDDEVIYDHDGNTASKDDQVRASGKLELQPVIDIDVDIDCCKFLVVPYLDTFEVKLGIEQHADLKITSQLESSFDKKIDLFTYRFTSFKFSIGPVPVWVTPILTVSIGADGTIEATATFQAAEDASVVAGIRYDDGWSNLSDVTFGFRDTDVDFSGQLKTKGYVSAQLDLFVYDLVGPNGELRASVEVDGKIPRDPTWTLKGCFSVHVGLNSIDLLDISHSAKVYEACREIGRADNQPPTVRIVSPKEGTGIQLGHQVNPWALGSDPEGGGLFCCSYRWHSDVDGELGEGSSIFTTFLTEGPRVLTVTITDEKGASTSASVNVTVVNSPPTVSIQRPTAGDEVYALEPTLLRGHGFDTNEPEVTLACERLVWTSSLAGDPQVSGCAVEVIFPNAGPRTLTLTGTDPQGLSHSASVNVDVQPARPNPAPLVTILSPENTTSIGPDTRITLHGEAVDPNGEAIVSYDWYFEGTHLGSGATLDWAPTDSFDIPQCEVSFRGALSLKATDASGIAGYDAIELRVVRIC